MTQILERPQLAVPTMDELEITELYLIRHAQDERVGGKLDGQEDPVLTEIGKDQAAELGKFLLDIDARFDMVLSSRKARALQTRNISLAPNKKSASAYQRADEAFNEYNWGSWAGQDLSEMIAGRQDEANDLGYDFLPNLAAETMRQKHAKMMGNIARHVYIERNLMGNPARRIAVFGHSFALKSFAAVEKAIPRTDVVSTASKIGHCAVIHLTPGNTMPQVIYNPNIAPNLLAAPDLQAA